MPKEKGYIYTTKTGYDPQFGKALKDPYLGDQPTLGACMPNIRRLVVRGDHIFLVSGKVPEAPQLVMAAMEVDKKINALSAWRQYPQHRLRLTETGQVTGNIIVTSQGTQHLLDTHDPATFANRIRDYVVCRNPLVMTSPREIQGSRDDTAYMLRQVLGKQGRVPIEIMGRWHKLDHQQIRELRDWLTSIKNGH